MIFGLINKNYLIGSINIFIATVLAAAIGIALIFQIKAFELQVTGDFSWHFFFHDLFATRLIALMVVAMIINTTSAFISMSGLYSHTIETNSMVYSISSIIWIVLYVAIDYSFTTVVIIPMVILLLALLILLGHQLVRLRTKLILLGFSLLVVSLPLIGRATDQNISNRVIAPIQR